VQDLREHGHDNEVEVLAVRLERAGELLGCKPREYAYHRALARELLTQIKEGRP